jgi:predicted RNA-binding protein YlxR (DUF448 family)
MEHDPGMLDVDRPDEGDDRRALERLCVATRLVRPVGELLRFVVSPDGVLTPDLKRKLPGRGAWVTASRIAFDLAVKKNAFSRALKRPVAIPDDLADRIDGLLERAALDMLSLANKAGLVVPGFAKVENFLASGRAAALLQAREGAGDGARKLAATARRSYLDETDPTRTLPPLVTIFQSHHFDLALGRSNVIHAALGAGPATTGFLERVAALAFWREGGLASAGPSSAQGPPPHAEVEPSMRDGRPATDGDGFLNENRGDPQDLARHD